MVYDFDFSIPKRKFSLIKLVGGADNEIAQYFRPIFKLD